MDEQKSPPAPSAGTPAAPAEAPQPRPLIGPKLARWEAAIFAAALAVFTVAGSFLVYPCHDGREQILLVTGGVGVVGLILVAVFGTWLSRPLTRRSQFTVFELVFVLALILAGLALGVAAPFSLTTPIGVFLAVLGLWRSFHTLAGRVFIEGFLPVVLWSLLLLAVPTHYHGPTGRNERAAVSACKAYAQAQEIYHRTDWDGDGVREYAQNLRGDRSLFERHAGSGDLPLVDQAFANADASQGQCQAPKQGYQFKILKGQGLSALGGAKSYFTVDPQQRLRMTEGHALVAWPHKWDETGRNTFIISQAGAVYQNDLGANTPQIVEGMEIFDPDPQQGWTLAE